MSSDARIGTELAGYRIERVIGRGGMGVVYLAEDTRLGRKVALKLLSPELAENERFRERFVVESRLAASLEHPNIVPIHAAGEADGVLYLAMRFIQGTDLRALIGEHGPIESERAVAIVAQVGRALDAAHAGGLVHRDVKPGNVLIAPMGTHDHCYLSDFGLTKQVSSMSGLTATGQLLGTLDYLAPETIAGKPVDGRADQYALACVLFECLTGETPFRRESEAAALWAHMQDSPPPLPSSISDHAALDAAIGRGLAKSPDDRFSSCSEFAAAASAALPDPRPAPITRSRRTLAAIAVTLVAAAGVGGALVARSGGGTAASPATQPINALIRIDPATNRVVGNPIRLERDSGQVVVSGDSVWVVSAAGRVLQRVDPVKQGVEKTINLTATPTGLAAGGSGSVWVAEGLANSIAQYQPGSGVLRVSPLPGCCPGSRLAEVTPAGVWITGPGKLTGINPGNSPTHANTTGSSGIASEGLQNVWLANGWDGVETINPVLSTAPQKVAVPGGPAGIAYADGFVWVASLYTDVVSEISTTVEVGSTLPSIQVTIPVGRRPCCVTIGAGAVWVANSADGTVSRINPATGAVTNTIVVGDRLGGIAYGAGSVWVTTQPSLAKDRLAGTLTYSDAGDLILQNADGSGRRKLTTDGADHDPSWSPDGSTVVFARGTDFGSHLFTIRPDGSALHQLTTGSVKGDDPVWSPDGRYIAFERGRNDRNSIWVVRPDGTGLRDVTLQKAAYGYPTWARDSSSVTAFDYTLPNYAPTQLMSFNLDGKQSRSLWSVPGTAFAPAWSPSGDLIAYGDSASGIGVYVTGRNGGGFTKLASLPPNAISGGRVGPAWSPDGSAIAFGGAATKGADLYVINADGTGLSRLTGDGQAGQPDWRPTQ